jgi:hypothetical protein
MRTASWWKVLVARNDTKDLSRSWDDHIKTEKQCLNLGRWNTCIFSVSLLVCGVYEYPRNGVHDCPESCHCSMCHTARRA